MPASSPVVRKGILNSSREERISAMRRLSSAVQEVLFGKDVESFLRWNTTGRICAIDKNGLPHCVAVWYLYHNRRIYIGTDRTTKWSGFAISKNQICFLVDVDIFYKNLDDWRAVQMKGTISQLSSLIEKKEILKLLKKKYLKYGGYEGDARKDIFFVITPTKLAIWGSWEKYKGSKTVPW